MERISSWNRSSLKREKKSRKSGNRKTNLVSTLSSKRIEKHSIQFDELFTLDTVEAPRDPLEDILDEIHESGERLKEQPTLNNIKKYRQAVSDFMNFIVKNTLDTDTVVSKSINPLKKQKRYTIIRVINEKLERLASGVLQNQLNQLKILEKIEEINGLIVNLLK